MVRHAATQGQDMAIRTRPEVVEDIVQQVHHVGRHVVEGDGRVAAAPGAVILQAGFQLHKVF